MEREITVYIPMDMFDKEVQEILAAHESKGYDIQFHGTQGNYKIYKAYRKW